MDLLYFKHLLIRTPLEAPARALRSALQARSRLRHPELREIQTEDDRISAAMRRLIRVDSNCVDVGAHIGSFLSEILRLAPRGTHAAFEPVPRKAAWLKHKFPEVAVHQMAVGDTPGEATFFEDLELSGFSGMRQARAGARTTCFTVQCGRLDDILPADRRVDFLKLDVEGAEILALRGAVRLVERWRPALLFESGPESAEQLGSSRGELFRFVTQDLGYQVHLPRGFLEGRPPLDAAAFDEAHVYPFRAFNYVGLPAGCERPAPAG